MLTDCHRWPRRPLVGGTWIEDLWNERRIHWPWDAALVSLGVTTLSRNSGLDCMNGRIKNENCTFFCHRPHNFNAFKRLVTEQLKSTRSWKCLVFTTRRRLWVPSTSLKKASATGNNGGPNIKLFIYVGFTLRRSRRPDYSFLGDVVLYKKTINFKLWSIKRNLEVLGREMVVVNFKATVPAFSWNG